MFRLRAAQVMRSFVDGSCPHYQLPIGSKNPAVAVETFLADRACCMKQGSEARSMHVRRCCCILVLQIPQTTAKVGNLQLEAVELREILST